MMKEDQEGMKAQAWGCPRHPKEIFKDSQASKVGDAQGIPFFINNYHVVSIETTFFIALHIMCNSWSVFVFYFQFFFYWSLQCWNLAFLFGRETRSNSLYN